MAGPEIMFSTIDTNTFFNNLLQPNTSIQDDNDISFDFKAGGGISYKLSDSRHIFIEYRYIHGSPTYTLERTVNIGTTGTAPAEVEIDVESHMVAEARADFSLLETLKAAVTQPPRPNYTYAFTSITTRPRTVPPNISRPISIALSSGSCLLYTSDAADE